MSSDRSIEDLICNAREGQADDTELADLVEQLEASPEARRQFIERSFLEAILEQEMELSASVATEPASQAQPRRLPLVFVSIASAAAAAIIVAAFFLLQQPTPAPIAQAPSPAVDPADSVPPGTVANVVWTKEAVWEQEASFGPGDDLKGGAPIGLASGKALLQTAVGTSILVGPGTRFQLVGESRIRLYEGDLGILVENANSIVCEVPGGEIRDIGTEFSLRTRGDQTQAQVYHGSIAATLNDVDERIVIKAGQGLLVDPSGGRIRTMKFTGVDFLQISEEADAGIGSNFGYPTLIQADGATRHWRFTELNSDKVENAIPLPTPLKLPTKSQLKKLKTDNVVLSLRDSGKLPATADLVDDLPELQRDFTIEFWFRAPNPNSNSAGSALLGIASTEMDRLNHLLLIKANGAWPTDGLRLGVLYRSRAGEHGLATITPKAVLANQWHYAAVRRQGNRLTTYLNGRPAVTQALPAGFIENGTARRLYLGHLTDTMGNNRVHPYKGDLDELAIYPMALSDAKILTHYRRGRALFYED